MSGCNQLRSARAVDLMGPVPRDAAEQLAGATPRPQGTLVASARGEAKERVEESAVSSMRLPKISLAEITSSSVP
jgi:hypothetical protein